MGDAESARSRNSDRIDIAAIPDTRIGRLTLIPATRQIRRDDGQEEVVEPRVMQVLLALARAEGGIVTRDQLTDSCWESRVVGEDAVNRVISRLRRVAEGIGRDSFRIETITKIGYRLIGSQSEAKPAAAPADDAPAAPTTRPNRRALLIGGGAALVGAVGYAALHIPPLGHHAQPPIPADAAALLSQAELTLAQDNGDSPAMAIGLLQRLTDVHHEIAQGWALLARAYASEAHSGPTATVQAMRQRAAEAADRALAIDHTNSTAKLAKAVLLPRRLNLAKIEAICRTVLYHEPNNLQAMMFLEAIMGDVGRCRERATILDKAVAVSSPTPNVLYRRVVALWSAGRLSEADRAMAIGYQVAPRHYTIWFTRFYLLLYTGRIEQAIGFAEDVDGRANGIPAAEFDDILTVARAMQSRAPDQIAKAARLCSEKARKGAGHAENSVQFLSTLGKLDEAFAVAQAYFFNRGFTISDLRFSREQGAYTRLDERRTMMLFLPSTAALRADPRFGSLVSELGLEAYWNKQGVVPDYRV